MNLLPKSSKDFGSVDYWEKFFQQRGKQAFEWYGTYLELCGVLHKYIKPREKVRVSAGARAGARGGGDCLRYPALGGPADLGTLHGGTRTFGIPCLVLAKRQR